MNVTLAKRRKILKIRVQHKGALSIKDFKVFIILKTKEKCAAPNEGENSNLLKVAKITSRQCDVYSETGHNARTCSKDIKSSNESESDES